MGDEVTSLKRRIEELEHYRALTDAMSSTQSLNEMLQCIADRCAAATRADHAAILLFNPAANESVQTLARNLGNSDTLDHAVNTIVSSWVAAQRKDLLIGDLVRDLGVKVATERQKKYGPVLAVPLENGGDLVGVVNVVKLKGRPVFTQDDLRLLKGLAPLASRFIQRARLQERLALNNARLRTTRTLAEYQHWVPSSNPKMQEIMDCVSRVAPTDASVLISGETGTGKELIAWSIHLRSSRATGPFVAVNCATIPVHLAESELFGYEKGAFTGADTTRSGKFEAANGGTIFLDEISAMPADLQPKLLRVLEGKRFCRVGSTTEMNVNVRVVAATNRDLLESVKKGEFREDLYHRLNVVPITLPPLRERKEDIGPLAEAFLKEFSAGAKAFAADALGLIARMEWRGNIRELRNLVERLAILSPAREISELEIRRICPPAAATDPASLVASLRESVRERPGTLSVLEHVEKELVGWALHESQGNVTHASELLGIERPALRRRAEKYGITLHE
jgi:transcriptional regulator with GAF, ATPase, and Fis domain